MQNAEFRMQTLLNAVDMLRRALAAVTVLARTWGPRRPFYVFTATMAICGIAILATAAEPSLLDAAERGDFPAFQRFEFETLAGEEVFEV